MQEKQVEMLVRTQTKSNDPKKLPPRRVGRPKLADVAALTDHIIVVARELFYDLGYGNTTMDMVAQKARISKETLYSRFDQKSKLFEAMVRAQLAYWAEGASPVNPAVHTHTLEEALRHHIEVQIRAGLSADFLNLSRVIAAEINHFPELSKDFLEATYYERITVIADEIRKYADIDGVAARDPESAAMAFRAIIGGWLQTLIAEGVDPKTIDQNALTERISEIFLASRPAW